MRSRRDVLRDNKDGIVDRPADAHARPEPVEGRAPRFGPAEAGHHVRFHQTRRTFITVGAAATGGLLVMMRAESLAAQMPMPAPSGPLGFPSEYIQIDPDDGVLIWSAQPEMGEGTKTSLAMIVADELDADWTRV